MKESRLAESEAFQASLYRVATAEVNAIRGNRTMEQARKTNAELEAMVQQFVFKVD